MVRIDRVHTGGGDKGESSLVDGSRRLKSDLRFSVVGDCDELNSIIGLVRMESTRVPMYHRDGGDRKGACLLYTSPSPRDMRRSRMPSSA